MASLQNYVAFVAIDQGDLYRLRADGTDFTRLTINLQVSGSDIFTITPTLAPDGAWLAFVVGTPHASDVFLIRPDGRDLHRLSSISGSKFDLHWSPDSCYLAFANEKPSWNATLYTAHIPTGQVSPLDVNPSFPVHPWYAPLPDFRPTPNKVDDHRMPTPLWIPPGKSLVPFTLLGYGYVQGWLRNNSHVVFRTLESGELFIIECQGEHFYQWQTAVEKPRVAGVRPDGQLVAYQSYGGTTLYLHELDQAEPIAIPHDYPHLIYFGNLQWSPDGRHLAYTVHHQLPGYIHIATIATASTRKVGHGTNPHWLPDGSHLTYSRIMHPSLPYPTQPVRYHLATATTTPLIEEIAEMQLSPWYRMPR